MGRAHYFYMNEDFIMDKLLIKEILACLSKDRTIFHYFRDRYALMLLKYFIGAGKPVSEIRHSVLSGLLNKPLLKDVLAHAGDGYVTPMHVNNYWAEDSYAFLLTVGVWSGLHPKWDQTSRKGYNLVLQLNFTNQHDATYKSMVRPEEEQMLNSHSHPVLDTDARSYFRETLAWARIDMDFETNEALIEEVQSDWVRKAKYLQRSATAAEKTEGRSLRRWGVSGKAENIIDYCDRILAPYNRIWAEAMLAASVDFIRREMGINTIYYHSDTTGYKVKSIRYDQPPRSLYSHLPRKFCFKSTNEAPDFLIQNKWFSKVYKRIDNPKWYVLSI